MNTDADWLDSREEAGKAIDIETCEICSQKAYDADPYGLLDARSELLPAMRQVGTNRYVRSPTSNGWVHESDLPEEKIRALYERLRAKEAAPAGRW